LEYEKKIFWLAKSDKKYQWLEQIDAHRGRGKFERKILREKILRGKHEEKP